MDSYNGREETVKATDGSAAQAPDWSMTGYSLRWNPSVPDDVHSDQTVNAVWTSDTTGKEIKPGTIKPRDVGSTITSGKNNYEVTSSDPYNPTVAFAGLDGDTASVKKTSSASDKSKDKKPAVKYDSIAVKIPASISADGVTYKVTTVAAKALSENKNITSVEIGSNVKSIKSKAFYKCSRLSKVKLKTKKIISMSSGAFKSVKSNAKFYTFNSKLSKYKSLLKRAGVKKPTMKRL